MKYIYTFCMLFIAFASSAQLKKGDWNIGTSTNAPMNLRLNTNGPGFKSYDFIINPSAGYFVKDRWEIGGGPCFPLAVRSLKMSLEQQVIKATNNQLGLIFIHDIILKKKVK